MTINMFVSDAIGINNQGHLTFGGADTVEIAREFSTPAYVLDENSIRENLREMQKALNENYENGGLVLFASKALSFMEMYRICKSENVGVDVVSGGEIYTAYKAGFDMEKVCFHGNNKTPDELKMAIDLGVGRIAVDNFYELNLLSEIALEKGKTVNILLRLKPGIDAHTHAFIQTGQVDSKYGFDIASGEALSAVKKALEIKNINLKGIHCHIGSQIFETEPFKLAASVMMNFIKEIKNEFGFEVEELNLGGGFAAKYLESDNPPGASEYIAEAAKTVNEEAEKLGIKVPFIMIEPGRSTVATAGITLYTVGSIKDIPDVRCYVSVDGGMTDNPRYILYNSDYTVVCANKADKARDFTATIAGKCCESGDLIQEHTNIQKPEHGDILAVLTTGAYNYSMSSNYNRNCKPPIIMVKDGVARLAVKRETYEDLIRNDM